MHGDVGLQPNLQRHRVPRSIGVHPGLDSGELQLKGVGDIDIAVHFVGWTIAWGAFRTAVDFVDAIIACGAFGP
jgi:hypothetical protein